MRLAAHCPKANKQGRLVEKKVCFISDVSTWGGPAGSRHLSKDRLSPPPTKQRVRAFIDVVLGWGGYMQKQAAISDSHLPLLISGLSSITLVVLGAVNLQFQGPFVLISLCPILGIVAALIMGTVW